MGGDHSHTVSVLCEHDPADIEDEYAIADGQSGHNIGVFLCYDGGFCHYIGTGDHRQ